MGAPRLSTDLRLPASTWLADVDEITQQIADTEERLNRFAQRLYALPGDVPTGERQQILDHIIELESHLDDLEHRLGLPTSKALALVDDVRAHHLGSGKAAELAGMPLTRFLRLLGQEDVPVFDYEDDDLDDEPTPSSGDEHP